MNSIKPSYYNVIIIHDPKRTMFAPFGNRNDEYNHNNDRHYMNFFFIWQSPVVSRACNLYCNIWQRKVKYNTLQMPWTDEKNTEKSRTKLRWIKVCEVNTDHVPRTCARVSSRNNGCQNANLWRLLWRRQTVVTKDKTLLFSITETVKSTLWPRQI